MRKYFLQYIYNSTTKSGTCLQYIDNSTTKSGTCCDTRKLKILRFQSFEISLKNVKTLNRHIVYLEENRFISIKNGPQYCKVSFYSKYVPMFNYIPT